MSRLRVSHREWRWLWPAAGMVCTPFVLSLIGFVSAALAIFGVEVGISAWGLMAVGMPLWLALAVWTVWARLSTPLDARELRVDGPGRALTHLPDHHALHDARRVSVRSPWLFRWQVEVHDDEGRELARVRDLRRSHAIWVARRVRDELGLDAPASLDEHARDLRSADPATFREGLDHVDISLESHEGIPLQWPSLAAFLPMLVIAVVNSDTGLAALVQFLVTAGALLGLGIGVAAASRRPRQIDLRIGRDGLGARVRAPGTPEEQITIPTHQLQPPELVPSSVQGNVLLISGSAGQQLEIAGGRLEDLQRIVFWLEEARTTRRALPEPMPEPPPALQRLRARRTEGES